MDISKHDNCVRIVKFYAHWITRRCRWTEFEEVEQDLWVQALLAKQKFVGKDLDRFASFLGRHLGFRSRNILNGYYKRRQRESEYAKLKDGAYWPEDESVESLTKRIAGKLKRTRKKSWETHVRVLLQLISPDPELIEMGVSQVFGRNGEPLQQNNLGQKYAGWQLGQYLNLSPMQVSRSLKAIQIATEQVIHAQR